MIYKVELRDKDGKLYRNSKGHITDKTFDFSDCESDENLIHMICRHTAESYETICKDGTQVNIDVMVLNEISKTYMTLYSYYGKEKRFVKLS
jgi:hypothetical protein